MIYFLPTAPRHDSEYDDLNLELEPWNFKLKMDHDNKTTGNTSIYPWIILFTLFYYTQVDP
jgi:hypothetical protein